MKVVKNLNWYMRYMKCYVCNTTSKQMKLENPTLSKIDNFKSFAIAEYVNIPRATYDAKHFKAKTLPNL